MKFGLNLEHFWILVWAGMCTNLYENYAMATVAKLCLILKDYLSLRPGRPQEAVQQDVRLDDGDSESPDHGTCGWPGDQ